MIVYVFAAVSALLSAVALFFLTDTLIFRLFARRLTAIVTGYETRPSKNGRFYYPVVEYADGGKRYRLKSDIGSNTPPFCIGQELPVLVFGHRHASARIRQHSRFFIAAVLGVMGIMFLAPLIIETDHAVVSWYLPSIYPPLYCLFPETPR